MKDNDEIQQEVIASTRLIADIIGRTQRRVRQLVNEGIITRKAQNQFPLIKVMREYISYLDRGDELKNDYDAELLEEKALHEKAKRAITELELAKRKEELIEVSEVEMILTGVVLTCKNRLLAIPSKASPKLTGITNINEINDILTKEIDQALNELSEFDMSSFFGGVESESEEASAEDSLENNEGTQTAAKIAGE